MQVELQQGEKKQKKTNKIFLHTISNQDSDFY